MLKFEGFIGEERDTFYITMNYDRLDAFNAKHLTDHVKNLNLTDISTLILHFPIIEYIDNSGLSSIVDCKKILKRNSCLKVVANNYQVEELFRIVRFDKIIPYFKSIEDALKQ